MKKAKLIFLALLVVLSLSILIPSTAHASDGGGRQVVKVEHIKVKLNLKHLSASQLKVFRNNTHNQTSLATPNVIAANACAAAPSDHNCDGQDPIYQGCTPTGSIVSTYTPFAKIGNSWKPIGTAFLKWSDDCESNWAYGDSGYDYYDGNYYTYHFTLTAVKVVRDDGLTEEYDQTTDTEGWSNMVFAPVHKARACILVTEYTTWSGGGGSGGSNWYCTGFY